MISEKQVWDILSEVKDPEIPVVSLVELGIIRKIQVNGGVVNVTITPTFSACPAMNVMEQDVIDKLKKVGFSKVEVEIALSPPWTSDWITDEARQKLKTLGLAPPKRHGGDFITDLFVSIECPYCDSTNTILKNAFGSALCRSIFYCNSCQQPFEYFKPI